VRPLIAVGGSADLRHHGTLDERVAVDFARLDLAKNKVNIHTKLKMILTILHQSEIPAPANSVESRDY